MSEKSKITHKKEVTNEQLLNSLKKQEKELQLILTKIEKMQEFHEINDMTNQVFEWRLGAIEEQLTQMNEKIKAI